MLLCKICADACRNDVNVKITGCETSFILHVATRPWKLLQKFTRIRAFVRIAPALPLRLALQGAHVVLVNLLYERLGSVLLTLAP